jgi:hypothetical protein
MATTEPDNIWSPDLADGFSWINHFALMAGSVQTALDGIHEDVTEIDERTKGVVADTGDFATIPLASGVTGDVRYRIFLGKLELLGQATGTFSPGQNIIGTIPTQGRPRAIRRAAVSKSQTGDSPSSTCRCEVNTSGVVSVWIPFGEDPVTWVDLSGWNVYA